MPADPHLHALFDSAPTPAPIDVRSVVRRSRARRVPKVLGITGVSVLAVGGIVLGSIQGLTTSSEVTAESAPMMDGGAASDAQSSQVFDEELKRAPAETLNTCGGSPAEVAPSATGLVLSVDFADASATSELIEGTVTMTNTGAQTLTGTTAIRPILTLAQNDVVLWHNDGVMEQPFNPITLAPGESYAYHAYFRPLVCSTEDELAFGYTGTLAAAAPGDYQVSAAIDFTGDFDAELVTGPAQTITLF